MLASGSLHQGMYNILQEWYEFIHANIHIQADLIGELPLMNIIASEIYFYVFFLFTSVYLRTSPEIVYERMKKRARSEESCVPLKYLQELHELHENWLIHGTFPRVAPVTNVNNHVWASNYHKNIFTSRFSFWMLT